jgi:hypothetical protein
MYLHPHFFVNIQNIFDPPPIQFTQIFIVLDIQLKEKKIIYYSIGEGFQISPTYDILKITFQIQRGLGDGSFCFCFCIFVFLFISMHETKYDTLL